MSSYTVEYLPKAQKVLDSVAAAMRQQIRTDVRRHANFASNISPGKHHRHRVRGDGFVAVCSIRHDAGRFIVMGIELVLL
jgi:hypothetical protein